MTFAEETILLMNVRAIHSFLCPADKLLAIEKHSEGFTHATVQRYPDKKRNAGEVLGWYLDLPSATQAVRRNGHANVVEVAALIR